MAETIFVSLRIVTSLIILGFPLSGGIIAVIVDYYDLEVFRFFKSDLSNYQNLDKILDIFYLSLEVYIVTSWKSFLVKYTAIFLFIFRLIGLLLFLIFQKPILLVIFLNLFEVFYLTYLVVLRIFKKETFSIKTIIIILTILIIPKIIHEYFLHINITHPWSQNKYVQILLSIFKKY